MYPVFTNGIDQSYSFHTFYDKLIEVCNSLRDEDRSLAFAFIFYDFESPIVKKVLDDNDYWQSLHELSGNYLTIFSIHQKPVVRIRANRADWQNDTNTRHGLSAINSMIGPGATAQALFSKYFGLEEKIVFPSIVFFQVNGEKVTESIIVELKETSVDGMYLSLKEIIKTAVDAVEDVEKQYQNNYKEVFDLISVSLRSLKLYGKIKRTTIIGKTLAELASLFKII